MPRAGFETAIPECESPQAVSLDRSATGVGYWINYNGNNNRETTLEYTEIQRRRMDVIYILFNDISIAQIMQRWP